MNNKERLKVYIDSDTSYQEYKQGKDGFNDAEMVNIEHCKDINELLEENDNLYAINEEHKKLNGELRDKVKHLKRTKNIMENYLQLIIDIGYDYDGCNTVESLKALIDELCEYAMRGRDMDDRISMYVKNDEKYNILNEKLKNLYTCMNCGREFEIKENDVCPYCGSADVFWGDNSEEER